MKPVTQTRFGDPEGNCFASCVASILECSLADIPDLNDQPKDRNWLEWFNEGLASKGVGVFYAEASSETPFNGYIPNGGHFIANGPGPRGLKHSVVMRALSGTLDPDGSVMSQTNELAHDPNPSGEGILKVSSFCFVLKI